MCGVTKVTIASDICGYVYDITDKSLSGVEISAKDDYKVCSDATLGSGHYQISLKVGTYTVRYKKKGYQT